MTYAPNRLRVTQDDGTIVNAPGTGEGHLEVAIHSPLNPFGSLHTERLRPEIQVDAVYGIPTGSTVSNTGNTSDPTGSTSATVTGSGNVFRCSTGTTAYSYGTLRSRTLLRYRPGQGVVGRYTAGFSTPAASSELLAGFGTSESGFYFGYNGTSFGILHRTGGRREIRTLTVTTASTATNDYEVELDGFTFTATATNNGSTVATANEIAAGTYSGWTANAVGSTVQFVADASGPRTGSFTLAQTGAGTPAAGTFATVLPAGVAATDTWIPQASWNGDKMDGTGPSGVTLNPLYGNVYEIGIQYLGYGAITFRIEAEFANGNNPEFVTVHTLRYPNTSTSTVVNQPSFPFTLSATSEGSTTNVSVYSASFAGFIEGDKVLNGPRVSPSATSASVTTTNNYCLFTIRNPLVFGSRANQAVLNILSLIPGHDDATPIIYRLLRNATLAGTPNFSIYSSDVPMLIDTAATTATVTTESQTLLTMVVGQSSSVPIIFGADQDLTLQPGESLTVTATATSGTSTITVASLNIRADL